MSGTGDSEGEGEGDKVADGRGMLNIWYVGRHSVCSGLMLVGSMRLLLSMRTVGSSEGAETGSAGARVYIEGSSSGEVMVLSRSS